MRTLRISDYVQKITPRQKGALYFAYSAYALFLLALPRILSWEFSCLKPIQLTSFKFDQCVATHILDTYLTLGMGGAGCVLIALFLKLRPTKGTFLLLSTVLAALLVLGYYLHLPSILNAATQADYFIQ